MSRILPTSASVRVLVNATPEAVWDVLTAPERVGEWSDEAQGGTWLPPHDGPRVGARFAGRSAVGRRRWTRTVEIVTCDPPHTLVWRTVPAGIYRDSTTWTVHCRAVGDGTEIEQSYVIEASRWLLRALWWLVPAHRDRTAGLTDDLRRLGEVAARIPT
jgi:uncharacterized protein YndB with AHSA1/START domain